MLGLYQKWGFKSGPFETRPLPASAEGAQLLIGRQKEVNKIRQRLLSPNKIVTVEGPNGIGKTSINNVASYISYQAFLDGESDQLLMPCDKVFQLRPNNGIADFIEQVFLQVGLTLVKNADTLHASGRGTANTTSQVTAWLQSPTFSTVSANLSAFGGGGKGTTVNSSTGFARAGFPDLVRDWLKQIFPKGEGGGIVCVIDNLELLRESEAARSALEELRDEVLTIEGLRWILCGSMGIVRTIAATPRMQGYLHNPIEIGDVSNEFTGQILDSRVDVYKATSSPYLPLLAPDFSVLYGALHGNIRDTLSAADDFCNWVADEGIEVTDDAAISLQFQTWLVEECTRRLETARAIVSARPWKLFQAIVDSGGQCSPGAFKDFGFATPQAMRSQILRLEAANLVKSVRDEEDNRRKTILLTSNGWMVEYARRSGYGSLFPCAPEEIDR